MCKVKHWQSENFYLDYHGSMNHTLHFDVSTGISLGDNVHKGDPRPFRINPKETSDVSKSFNLYGLQLLNSLLY